MLLLTFENKSKKDSNRKLKVLDLLKVDDEDALLTFGTEQSDLLTAEDGDVLPTFGDMSKKDSKR